MLETATQSPIDRLLAIMRQLRNPDGGCEWDLAQSFATIAPYTIEEAYEVADAIERSDMVALRDELGDLLLQVVLHAQIASETNTFDLNAVAQAISDKLVRRHPHVFGGEPRSWDAIKNEEQAAALKNSPSPLSDRLANKVRGRVACTC